MRRPHQEQGKAGAAGNGDGAVQQLLAKPAMVRRRQAKPRHHQRQNDHRQGLDHELRKRQIRRAEQQENHRHGKALNAERDDGGQPARRRQDSEKACDRDGDEGQLMDLHIARPRGHRRKFTIEKQRCKQHGGDDGEGGGDIKLQPAGLDDPCDVEGYLHQRFDEDIETPVRPCPQRLERAVHQAAEGGKLRIEDNAERDGEQRQAERHADMGNE
ncbi:hypothetical protein D3C80_1354800 [compost metagenome]